MCLATILGTVLSIATSILVGVWGILMLVLGIMGTQDPNFLLDNLGMKEEIEGLEHLLDMHSFDKTQAVLIIIIGLVMVAVGLFGLCCGQCNKLCRLAYVLGLLTGVCVLFVILLIFTTSAGASLVKDRVETGLQKSFDVYLKHPEEMKGDKLVVSEEAKPWFNLQSKEQCCGLKANLSDFKATAKLPPSCCQLILQHSIPSTKAEYSNFDSCIKDHPKYANLRSCSSVVVASFLQANTFVNAILLCALFLSFLSLVCASFVLGD